MLLSSLFPNSIRRRESNAEVLRWQARFRVAFALLVGVLGGALHAAGVLATSPVAARWLDGVSPVVAEVALTVAYLTVVLLVDRRVRHAGSAPTADGTRAMAGVGRGAVLTVTAADLALVFGSVILTTPPAHFDRALLLSLFGLQVTQIYHGRLAATLWALATELGYAGLVRAAESTGVPVRWPEELWTLALYAFGATLFILLQGNQGARLTRLVRMFERAEEGDFSLTYDVRADSRPDNVTLVGRAYNRMRAQLATIVLTDPLSGCLNRRGFEQQLTRDVRRAARSRGQLSLLAVDLDHFKLVNDTYGHLAGDAVIREAGELLRGTARASDVVARVGGEEFVVLAPDAGAPAAQQLASRIAEAFRARDFAGVQGRMPITVSVGVVSDRVRDEHAGADLHARADEALYAAKRGGRDRVVVWTPGPRPADAGGRKQDTGLAPALPAPTPSGVIPADRVFSPTPRINPAPSPPPPMLEGSD
ncbi:MAG: diguanylate cyclase [Gemmatimonadaceae bacterium]